MSAMDDVFGAMPNRPNHPDFWKLSEIILRLDGALEAAPPNKKQEVFAALVAKRVDPDSLSYVALNRALRALGITSKEDVAGSQKLMAICSAMYLDGFTAGCEFSAKEQ